MVRKHGFQLPAHTYQVVAITVYCLLAVEFYAFLAPFLGGRIWEYALVATYSPVALIVFILYVRSTAINPADPGIMSRFDNQPASKLNEKHGESTRKQSGRLDENRTDGHSSPYSLSRSSTMASNMSKIGSARELPKLNDPQPQPEKKRSSCSGIRGIFCLLFVHEDCRKEEDLEEQQGNREDALFCTLCNSEGLTTYEYVVAMRAMSEAAPGAASDNEDLPNELYSPSGSATTGFSGGSSLGLQYKGAWSCTPPRVFVDYQEEVVPHLEPGMVPSTTDPDATRQSKAPRKPVKRSAFKLAKLDPNEVMKVAAKARASSSVLRPVENRRLQAIDDSSSENISIQSSMSTDMGANKDTKGDFRISSMRNSVGQSQGSRDEYETGTQSMSSFSSPSHVHESVTLSPLPRAHGSNHFNAVGFDTAQPSTSRGTFHGVDPVSSFPTIPDDKRFQKESSTDPLLLSASTALLRDVKRTSVIWDQEAGRYVSVPTTNDAKNRTSQPITASKNNTDKSNYSRRTLPVSQPEESSSSRGPLQQSDKLMYTGESIFFGGPLLSIPGGDGAKSENPSIIRRGQERLVPNISRESRFKRDTGSNQLPVFVPGGFAHNPQSSSGLR
ncbi:putative protein S-acyltransferase 19 [Bienertia sinuspersici]